MTTETAERLTEILASIGLAYVEGEPGDFATLVNGKLAPDDGKRVVIVDRAKAVRSHVRRLTEYYRDHDERDPRRADIVLTPIRIAALTAALSRMNSYHREQLGQLIDTLPKLQPLDQISLWRQADPS
jgi:hypothetical protein